MPRRPALFVVAIAALLVAPASAEQGKAPAQCRKSDRCTLSGGDADGTTRRANGGAGSRRRDRDVSGIQAKKKARRGGGRRAF